MVTKNSPSSRPLKGRMSASTWSGGGGVAGARGQAWRVVVVAVVVRRK